MRDTVYFTLPAFPGSQAEMQLYICLTGEIDQYLKKNGMTFWLFISAISASVQAAGFPWAWPLYSGSHSSKKERKSLSLYFLLTSDLTVYSLRNYLFVLFNKGATGRLFPYLIYSHPWRNGLSCTIFVIKNPSFPLPFLHARFRQ